MLDRLLNASLQSLSKDDIELIANGGVQEDSVIEFKEGLDETAERDQRAWAEGGKLSRTSKADLIKELIAFSNAYGGTLYFGVKESNDVQRRSAGILPISRIFDLETALCDALRDSVDPPGFDSKAFDLGNGAGVLVIRVPASPIAPHWNASERRCYLRIGTSSQQIGMREIHSIVLDRARTSDAVEKQFVARQIGFKNTVRAAALKFSEGLNPLVTTNPDYSFPLDGMALRCTGVPLSPIYVNNITQRQDLRIGTKHARVTAKVTIPGTPKKQGINNYQNINEYSFQPALRGWLSHFESRTGELTDTMLVRGDGLIERVFIDFSTLEPRPGGGGKIGVDFTSIVGFVLCTITAVEAFRTLTGTSEVPYELEFELITFPNRFLISPIYHYTRDKCQFSDRNVVFPRLLLGTRDSLKAVGDAIQIDISNAAGQPAMLIYEFDVEGALAQHGL